MTAGSTVRPGTDARPQGPGPGTPWPGWPPRLSPRLLVSLLPGLLASFVAPELGYALIRPHVASSVIALLIVMAIPVGWSLGTLAWRRRVSRLGLLSVAVSVIALAVMYLTGGSALAVKLQDPATTGALGLACLVSVIARRPLYLMALRPVARRSALAARVVADPAVRRTATVSTAIIGAFLLVHAIAVTILALTLPTGTFLAVYRLVGVTIIAAGLAVLIWYRRSRGWKIGEILAPRAGGADDDPPG